MRNIGHLQTYAKETLDSTTPSTDRDVSFAKPGDVVVAGANPSTSPAYQGVAQVQISLDPEGAEASFFNAPGTSAFTNAGFAYALTVPAARARVKLTTATAGSLDVFVGAWDRRS